MNPSKLLAVVSILFVLGGCASHQVQKGALIGALSGVALGTGLGLVLSEPDLLGSGSEGPGGDTALPVGGSMLAGAAIGAVMGGIVGAMVGHQRDDGYERKKPEPPPASEPQARAPYLRGL
jgi:hypothetical protein